MIFVLEPLRYHTGHISSGMGKKLWERKRKELEDDRKEEKSDSQEENLRRTKGGK